MMSEEPTLPADHPIWAKMAEIVVRRPYPWEEQWPEPTFAALAELAELEPEA